MKKLTLALVSLLLVGTAIAAIERDRRLDHAERFPVRDRPIEVASEGYDSSRACRSCHPGEYATWYASYHRRMTQVATAETVAAPFDGEVTIGAVKYKMSKGPDGLHITLPNPRYRDGVQVTPASPEHGTVPEPPTLTRRVVLSTGSHHYQAYWFPSGDGRNLVPFDMTWFIAERRWMPIDAVFIQPQETARGYPDGLWNSLCGNCHSTHLQPRLVGAEVDTRVAEFGIACESCHGPGGHHVQTSRNPLSRWSRHRADRPDPSIVQPARLSQERGSQVCGQCHAVTELRSAREYEVWAESGTTYRPGDDLLATRNVLHADPEGENIQRFWPDGMVLIAGREYNALTRSGCYTRGEMTCFSCHKMHPQSSDAAELKEWANDQLGPAMRGDEACLGCHQERRADLAAHTHHRPESEGSRCYNCHAPYTSYGRQNAQRSHEIDSPRVQVSVEHGRPNACNLCHLDQTLGWSARHLERWYGIQQPAFSAEQNEVAASLLWLLKGDAVQRALVAWHMGWEPARVASGTAWMAPFLARLLTDPYTALRAASGRSIHTLPGFTDLEYDFLASPVARELKAEQALRRWQQLPWPPTSTGESRLLMNPDHSLRVRDVEQLAAQRDDRKIVVAE